MNDLFFPPVNITYDRELVIKESWERSYSAKVNKNDGRCSNILSQQEIKQIWERDNELMEIAVPLMEMVFEYIKNTGCVLILINKEGRIIANKYDTEIHGRLRRINFVCGASWLEGDVGTNAIGTALVIEKPLQILGSEHYCSKHHLWSCSAAPIFDSAGSVLGIVDISGYSDSLHPHTLGIVAMLAKMISMQYRMNKINTDMTLANSSITKTFNRISDGIMELDKNDVVIYINPAVTRILAKPQYEILHKPITRIFNKESTFLREIKKLKCSEEIYHAKNKEVYHLYGEPIIDKIGNKKGTTIILKKIEEGKKFIINNSGKNSTNNKNIATISLEQIIGESQAIKECKDKAALVAGSRANILLQGESGTGKEIFAQAIHEMSSQQKGPFIAVNCGAIPGNLLVSELFGYEAGAFTGALKGGKSGKFEQANGGTLFLDEIGELPLEQQVALLRVLQERKITRIGGNKAIPIDVRIISATNKNLRKEVANDNFREDLYFRLKVVALEIPPLRERKEDIELLFEYFLRKYTKQHSKEITIDPNVIKYLLCYNWPGNVRELENVVERLVCLAQNNRISLADLPKEILDSQDARVQQEVVVSNEVNGSTSRGARKLRAMEQECRNIIILLDKNGGNITRTAKDLGISRTTLYRKMKDYDIKN